MTSSIVSRFAISIGANLLRASATFASGMLVARGLGPEQYGRMMFLLGTFIALRQLLDMGSSTAFFTFLSQRQRGRRFVTWFAAWMGVQFSLPLLAIGLIFPAAWIELVWEGEQRSLVVLAFLAAYLQTTLWSVMMQAGESQRLTRWVQGIGTVTALFHLCLVVVCWWQEWLGVRLLFVALIAEWGLAAWIVAKQLDFPDTSDADEGFRAVLREFWRYCLPLVPYTWLGFVYEFADRWLLQNHGGSIEQAFYSVGQQFGAVAALATASVMNVFWKEIAEAHHRDNLERVAMLYRKVSRGLFFIAAAIAGFLVPWAAEILRIVLGPAYVGGATALAVMLLYPLHQSMGQIGGTMMYATGHVRAQVIIGMAFMATSIVVTYFVLAPVDATIPGFSLGSAGLAAKMVILQILSVNAVAFYLARSLRVRFDWTYQLVGSVVCLMAGWLAHIAAWSWFDMSVLAGVAMGMLIAACLYVFLLCAVIWSMPALAGLERDEIAGLIRRVRGVGFRRNAR